MVILHHSYQLPFQDVVARAAVVVDKQTREAVSPAALTVFSIVLLQSSQTQQPLLRSSQAQQPLLQQHVFWCSHQPPSSQPGP